MDIPILASGLRAPEGPVALEDGRIACVEMASGRTSVTLIDADGAIEMLVDTGGRPNGLARDGLDRFWVAGGPRASVGCFDANGALLARTNENELPFLFPNDLAFGPDGALYVTDSGWLPEDLGRDGRVRPDFRELPYAGRVVRIDPSTGQGRTLTAGLRFANGLAFDPTGALFVNESATGDILRVEADGTQSWYANVLDACPAGEFVGPDGMAFGKDGTLFCAVYGAGHVAIVPSGGGRVAGHITTKGIAPSNVAFARDGSGNLFITEIERGELLASQIGIGGLDLHAPRFVLAQTNEGLTI